MAYTFPQYKVVAETEGPHTTLDFALDSAVAVGERIDVLVSWGNNPDEAAGSMADDLGGGGSANVYTEATACRTLDGTNSQQVSRFTCIVTQAGTPTITWTLPGSRNWGGGFALVITGAGDVDKTDSDFTVTTTPATPSVTPVEDGELILGLFSDSEGTLTDIDGDGAFTEIFVDVANRYQAQYLDQTTAAAIVANWTITTGTGHGHVSVVTYKAAGGGIPETGVEGMEISDSVSYSVVLSPSTCRIVSTL